MTDFDACARLLASPRAKYMGGPYDTSGAWGWFCHGIALWHLFGHGTLMVDLKANGETIGEVRINAGPRFLEREIGWSLYDGFEGHGYATEAAARIRDWAFETQGFETLVSYIDADNAGSIAVAERLGAKRDATAPRNDPEDIVYRHTPPD